MICADRTCFCGITSDSLVITGSGAEGDPWHIDSMAFEIVTSGTRPSSPTTWQHIFETDTGRQMYWNGTNWVWVAGNPPSFQIERQAVFSLADNTETTITLPTEVVDTDTFHAGSDGFVTIPAGWGGDYFIVGHGQFAANATGNRYIRPLIASNATPPAQNNGSRTGGWTSINTALNGYPYADRFRLEAGATVTLRGFQNSGAPLDVSLASLKGFLINHIPSLT